MLRFRGRCSSDGCATGRTRPIVSISQPFPDFGRVQRFRLARVSASLVGYRVATSNIVGRLGAYCAPISLALRGNRLAFLLRTSLLVASRYGLKPWVLWPSHLCPAYPGSPCLHAADTERILRPPAAPLKNTSPIARPVPTSTTPYPPTTYVFSQIRETPPFVNYSDALSLFIGLFLCRKSDSFTLCSIVQQARHSGAIPHISTYFVENSYHLVRTRTNFRVSLWKKPETSRKNCTKPRLNF